MNTTLLTEILITLLFSAFFSASEIAFITSNKLLFELENRGKSLTKYILNRFYANPNQFISAMLVGNNIALVIYGLLMSQLLKPLLTMFISGDMLVLLLQSVIATLFILFAGEFIPKTLGRINPNFFLSIFSLPLYLIYIVLYPVSQGIFMLVNLIFRIFGVKIKKTGVKSFGRSDLDNFLQKTIDETPEKEDLDTEVRFFQNAIEFSQIKVRDCMIPRTEIIALDKSASLDELTAQFVETGFSKIVVYEGDIDNITGYVHSSELFSQPADWTKSIVGLSFVPENMAANKLMKSMLSGKKSMVIAVDEFGGTAGLITLEDLVEEIFGEIEDEHDTRLVIAKQVNDNEYILSGRMEIDRVNEMFDLDIPESDEYLTIAGYILAFYQNFPKLNETLIIDRFEFKALKVTRPKIELVRLRVLKD
ncbi:MAG: hemolysin family protein [Dysgonamonadaceae bacterium]|jgi:CBS domain containing-hemolysin-like protein|nr:hemolysin family protein [Dysgonamonadaceae bacterium]